MANEQYPVFTLKNECQDCYKCIRECPAKAIKICHGRASILNDRCVVCGHCVTTCPANAKRVRNDLDRVQSLLNSSQQVLVSLAPSWRGVYSFSESQMVLLLKHLGFFAVSETALGAQEVSIKTAAILNEGKSGLYISSACPVVTRYIQLYHGSFVDNIVAGASPAITHAAWLKKQYQDIAVVFIGPCIAKKSEADQYPNLVSAALTFDELNLWINESFIDTNDLTHNSELRFVPEMAYEGAIYPLEGGMNDTIRRVGVNSDVVLMALSSLGSLKDALWDIDRNHLTQKIFIEALACKGGCINGPCFGSKKSKVLAISEILANLRVRRTIPREGHMWVDAHYPTIDIKKYNFSPDQINEAMVKIGKGMEASELNCGGCGYSTCKELACALLAGDAEPAMCVSYTRELATRKANAMVKSMSSAIVIVNKSLEIIESNKSFMRMFCNDVYDIFAEREGGIYHVMLDKFITFSNLFKKVLETGLELHREHYLIEAKVYDIKIFSIERGELVGAIISDVTKTEMDKEKIVEKAREVIVKNIATVQEIASLLGEHMAETEILLNSIVEDYAEKIN